MAKKSKEAKREHDERLLDKQLSAEKFKEIVRGVSTVFKWGALAFCAWCLAGKSTSVEAVFKGELNKYAFYLVLLLTNAVTAVGWRIERRLRRAEVADLAAENKRLESLIDPKRTSTFLGASGEPVDAEFIDEGRPAPKLLSPPRSEGGPKQ